MDKIFLEALKKEKRDESITLTQENVSLVPKKFRFEELLWKYGIRYASFIKKIPLLRDIAEKIYYQISSKTIPRHRATEPDAVGSQLKNIHP